MGFPRVSEIGKKGDNLRIPSWVVTKAREELVGPEVRLGVVGCGKMGLLHASLLNTIPNASVVALCEKSPRIARFLRKMMDRKDVKVVENIEDLKDLALDAVYVTTPIPSHYSIIRTIMSKGISVNVFSEKTLSSDKNQSDQLSFWGKDGLCMVGYHKRFGVTFRKAKEILDSGGIGAVRSFDACAFSSDFYGPSKKSGPKPNSSSSARGGVLRDLGCHAIDLALWYFGDYHVVKGEPKSNDASEQDIVRFDVEARDSITGRFSASWSLPDYRMPYIGLSIKGTGGRLDVSDDKIVQYTLDDVVTREWYRPTLGDNVEFLLGGSEYQREDSYYISCLATNEQPKPNFATGLLVDSVISEAIASAA